MLTRQRQLLIICTTLGYCASSRVVNSKSGYLDSDQFYQQGLLARTSQETNPIFQDCREVAGVCMASRACPWENVLEDTDLTCLYLDNDFVCCGMNRTFMPDDMFPAVKMTENEQ